jgi:predicted site-specific integrase-resolvase
MNQTIADERDRMTVEEAAAYMGVHYKTAWNYREQGKLDVVTDESGRKFVTRESVESLKAALDRLKPKKEKQAA